MPPRPFRGGSMLELRDASSQGTAAGYLTNLAELLPRVPAEALDQIVDLLLETRAAGRRVYLMGNGGSAATASHLACDLLKTAHVPPHTPLRVSALPENAALMTAWANDTSFERVFAGQIE